MDRGRARARAPVTTTKAVLLARGLGTRMRARAGDDSTLTPAQSDVAARGVKAMIPLAGGRPFLDYLLDALTDAGIEDVCLVIGPEHTEMRDAYAGRVSFAVQERPVGTADAVLAAKSFAAGEPFLVMNSDNYYPVRVLAELSRSTAPALPAFSREGLLRDGHIAAERIARYALLDVDADGMLRRIIEKPDDETLGAHPNARISMNCWSFTSTIFDACRAVPISPRGELELPVAVQHAISVMGIRIRAFPVDAPVLDLSHQSDIPRVAQALDAMRADS